MSETREANEGVCTEGACLAWLYAHRGVQQGGFILRILTVFSPARAGPRASGMQR